MPCDHIGGAIVCTRGRRHRCSTCLKPSTFQCDWKVGKTGAGKPKTCDRHICAAHAQQVGTDKHLCPDHQAAFRQWKAQHPEKVTS